MVAGTPVNLSATCSNRDTSRAWMLSNISFWFPSRSLDVYVFPNLSTINDDVLPILLLLFADDDSDDDVPPASAILPREADDNTDE